MTPGAAAVSDPGCAAVLAPIADILAAVAWPLLVLAAGIVFRRELRDLLKRIREGAGLKFEPVSQKAALSATAEAAATVAASQSAERPADGAHGASQPSRVRTPASSELEASIRTLIPLQGKEPAEREELLVAVLARFALLNEFLIVELLMWGSQIGLMGYLAAHVDGETVETIERFFYQPARERFPDQFANYSFDAYLGFLVRNRLVHVDGQRAWITPKGREYLQWRAAAGRPNAIPG